MPEKFATEPPLQVALRELRRYSTSWRFWLGFGAVMVLLATIGPFGTITSMDAPTRLVYWTVISLATFYVGAGTSILIGVYLIDLHVARWLAWVVGGVIAGIPAGVLAWFIATTLFNLDIADNYTLPQFLTYTAIISLAIAILSLLISNAGLSQSESNISRSIFFNRLPVHLGKTLLSLEAQDHYLNVKTTKGSELILLRMGDAEKELADYQGLRVHRSWWVARDAILKISRKNGRTDLILSDNSTVPVSRTYLKILKEAGIR